MINAIGLANPGPGRGAATRRCRGWRRAIGHCACSSTWSATASTISPPWWRPRRRRRRRCVRTECQLPEREVGRTRVRRRSGRRWRRSCRRRARSTPPPAVREALADPGRRHRRRGPDRGGCRRRRTDAGEYDAGAGHRHRRVGSPKIGFGTGGVSGPALLPLGVLATWRVSRALPRARSSGWVACPRRTTPCSTSWPARRWSASAPPRLRDPAGPGAHRARARARGRRRTACAPSLHHRDPGMAELNAPLRVAHPIVALDVPDAASARALVGAPRRHAVTSTKSASSCSPPRDRPSCSGCGARASRCFSISSCTTFRTRCARRRAVWPGMGASLLTIHASGGCGDDRARPWTARRRAAARGTAVRHPGRHDPDQPRRRRRSAQAWGRTAGGRAGARCCGLPGWCATAGGAGIVCSGHEAAAVRAAHGDAARAAGSRAFGCRAATRTTRARVMTPVGGGGRGRAVADPRPGGDRLRPIRRRRWRRSGRMLA